MNFKINPYIRRNSSDYENAFSKIINRIAGDYAKSELTKIAIFFHFLREFEQIKAINKNIRLLVNNLIKVKIIEPIETINIKILNTIETLIFYLRFIEEYRQMVNNYKEKNLLHLYGTYNKHFKCFTIKNIGQMGIVPWCTYFLSFEPDIFNPYTHFNEDYDEINLFEYKIPKRKKNIEKIINLFDGYNDAMDNEYDKYVFGLDPKNCTFF